MPKREDERWAGEQSELRYCYQHKRYYKANAGCQLCADKKLGGGRELHENKPTLKFCPVCNKVSLFWNVKLGVWECLNLKCKCTLTPEDLYTQENIRQTELIRCKHCNKKFSASDYETHLKLLARSARPGATCPECRKLTYYLSHNGVWECLNIKCPEFQKTQSVDPTIKQDDGVIVDPSNKPSSSVIEDREHVSDEESMKLSEEYDGKILSSKKGDKFKKRGVGELPKWIIALLFVIVFSIVGIALSLFVGKFIPLWILFGFSFIFSIEKWLNYFTRNHKSLGMLYRLFLNLSILALFGLFVWTGIKLFSQQLVQTPLVGSLLFLSEFVFFIWMWRTVSKNSWRRPSMKLTVFSLICLSAVFAYAGVQPMANYKDSFFSFINTNNSSSQPIAPSAIPTTVIPDTPAPPLLSAPVTTTQRPTPLPNVTATPIPAPIPTRTPTPSLPPTPQTPTPIPPILDKTVTIDSLQYRAQFWQFNPNGKVEATVTLPTEVNILYSSNWAGYSLKQVLENAKAGGDKVAWAVVLAAEASENPSPKTPSPTATAPKPSPAPSPTAEVTVTPITTPTATSRLQELYQYMLDLINKDRKNSGLSPVVLGSNGAAQKHAEEELANNYQAHWGMAGMKPYMRYTLAGGYNYEGENLSGPALLKDGVKYATSSAKEMLDEAEAGLMSSAGHRRNILDKWHKKVNLGIAYNNYTLALVQQFEGDYVRFSKLPAIESNNLSFSGEIVGGFILEGVQIWHDPLPSPLTRGQLWGTYAYNAGRPVAFLRKPLQGGWYYDSTQTSYSWEADGADPYSLPPDNPLSSGNLPMIRPVTKYSAMIKWVDAKRWTASGPSFDISADLSGIIATFGKGVYTVRVWGKTGGESLELTNYSIFVK